MGADQSTTSSKESDVFLVHCKEVYDDLTSPKHSFKDGVVSLLGGPSTELGEKLYSFLFHDDTNVDSAVFFAAMTKLRAVLSCEGMELCRFFFSLFLGSEGDLEIMALQMLLHSSVSCSLHIGLSSELLVPKNHPLLLAINTAIMHYNDHHKEKSHAANFEQWHAMHSPHLLTGLRQWLSAIVNSEKGTAYHLPLVECADKERQLQLSVTMWVLSSVLPTVFLGALQSDRASCQGDLPKGGNWTCLYSSRAHGFSMNRFQHHCFDYKQPSIMMVTSYHKLEDRNYSFALAMDAEWRDGTYFYGGEKFHLIQLEPTYSLLKRGPKLVSLNEKQRGFPNGLRVMASQKYDYCLLEVKPSLAEARLTEGDWMQIQLVEVWGCGGMQAKETQLRLKEWEARQVMRRREIHSKNVQTMWEDNPDRFLLEMGGVNTSREQKTD